MNISLSGLKSNRINISGTKKAELSFSLEGVEASDDMTIDCYPVENPSHPDRHIGYWVFSSLNKDNYTLRVDLTSVRRMSIRLFQKNRELSSVSCWLNPKGFLDPVIDLQMVIRREDRIEKMLHLILSLRDPKELERFYKEDGEGGAYHIDTLNLTFHKRRMKVLKRLFRKYVRGGAYVADLGSGIGFLKLLGNPYKYRVYCLDLDFPHHPEQAVNDIFYILGNVLDYPFQEHSFDALYSGEVVEHLLNPEEALHSWRDLLKDKGILVLTTPNLKRMINRARGYDLPLSKEHVNEMSLQEWEEILTKSGFNILRKRGIYLELLLTWWRRKNIVDILQSRWNKKAFVPLMKFFMMLGYRLPSHALDMMIVAQKK
ncbi:MAG: methyltransferase domain-containing protein [Candidatus Aminicenantes bacterium]|nr:methyltransferase domain-containing protein [Candidatus Aminicenantes bacterium]